MDAWTSLPPKCPDTDPPPHVHKTNLGSTSQRWSFLQEWPQSGTMDCCHLWSWPSLVPRNSLDVHSGCITVCSFLLPRNTHRVDVPWCPYPLRMKKPRMILGVTCYKLICYKPPCFLLFNSSGENAQKCNFAHV